MSIFWRGFPGYGTLLLEGCVSLFRLSFPKTPPRFAFMNKASFIKALQGKPIVESSCGSSAPRWAPCRRRPGLDDSKMKDLIPLI